MNNNNTTLIVYILILALSFLHSPEDLVLELVHAFSKSYTLVAAHGSLKLGPLWSYTTLTA